MAQALQSAQQSLQQAGQQAAQEGEASDAEMGQEFRGGSGQGPGQDTNQRGNGRQLGGGRGGPGRGVGGNVGAQQPLPGQKKDQLVPGTVNQKGQKLTRTFTGLPDPSQDRAAYYDIVTESKKAAEASLNREEIPTGYRKQVRDYFESIQSGR